MADAILQKVKVNREDAYFKWIKNIEIKWGENVLSSAKRTDEFNVILYLALINLMSEMGDNVAKLDYVQYVVRASALMPGIFTSYCQINLIMRGVIIDESIQNALIKKIESKNLTKVFQDWTMNLVKEKKDPFALDSTIRAYSFGENIETKFIDMFVQEFIPLDANISDVTDLVPGSSVCGCTLVKLISKKSHSQVWEAVMKNRKTVIKLEPLDLDEKEIKKMIGSSSFEKILEHIRATDQEYLNYLKLKDYPYKLNYFNVEYFHPLRMKVKVMSWLDGPIDKVLIEDKKTLIYGLFDLIFELHKRGFMYNGFKPSHIMIKPHVVGEEIPPSVKSHYRIIDYKYMTSFKGVNLNMVGDHASLALLSGTNIVTPYDDIESMLYTINDIISSKVLYNDKKDEYIKKSELSTYSVLISNAITSLRTLRQQDMYVNGMQTPVDYVTYINDIYDKGLTVTDSSGINTVTIPGIRTIVGTVFNSFNEISPIEVSLVAPDFELLKKIKSSVVMSPEPIFLNLRSDPTKTNEVCMAILNYQVNGYTPPLEFEPYVLKYFSY